MGNSCLLSFIFLLFFHISLWIADSSCLSQEDREKYEESRKVADDWYSGMYGAWEEGLEKGREEGETHKSLTIAKNLLAMNLPITQIMQATGLTMEQVDSLKH